MPDSSQPDASLLSSPWFQIALIGAGLILLVRELRDLRARDRFAADAGDGPDLGQRRRDMLLASVKVLVGSFMMVLFGVSLMAGSAGLVDPVLALNIFAVLMIPAIAAIFYTSLWGVPDIVAEWIFGGRGRT